MAHLCGRAIDMLVVLQSSVVINHHQSSSSCLPRLRLASCREPLAASRLQRATCGERRRCRPFPITDQKGRLTDCACKNDRAKPVSQNPTPHQQTDQSNN